MRPVFFLREALRALKRNAVPSFAAMATVLVGSRHSSVVPSGTRWRIIRSAVQRTVATVGMPIRW